LLEKTLTQLGIFVVFAAPGYAVAALTMDRLGRKTIQALGFGMMAVSFALLALIPNLEKMVLPFLIIYGFSFFFTEFGPNATTFVYPSEIFPCACAPPVTESLRLWANSGALSASSSFLTFLPGKGCWARSPLLQSPVPSALS
jgi:MFS family permease